jgi:biopolymer transport protein ExbB
MAEIIHNSGPFAYPLGLCSFLAVVVIIERLIALRKSQILSNQDQVLFSDLDLNEIPIKLDSVVGVIYHFSKTVDASADTIRAKVQVEVTKMERGLFILDIVTAVAPLLGLLGTVSGLVQVFSNFGPESGIPDTGSLVKGIALALSTTVIGLSIAIPAVVGSSFLNRKIDSHASTLENWGEFLIQQKKSSTLCN